MFTIEDIISDPITTRNVVMVGYSGCEVLDITGPLEILAGVDLHHSQNTKSYDITIVASKAGPLLTSSGISLIADKSFAQAEQDDEEIDTLIVAGGMNALDALKDQGLMDYVKRASSKARRTVSICSGTFILAELGLLDNLRATTHWMGCQALKDRYPKINVEPDAIYIKEGNIWTSAGVTSGMDLALGLIEEDYDHELAMKIARNLVMYMQRSGGQSQFSEVLFSQTVETGPISQSMNYILEHFAENLTVTPLAVRACMSERSFSRKFKDKTGLTPAHYVESVRIQEARNALEQTDDTIDHIALITGFGNGERMRRSFRRNLGLCATDYRERFQIKKI